MTFVFGKDRMTAYSGDGVPMGHISFAQIRKDLVNITQVVTMAQFRGQAVADSMMEAFLTHLSEGNQKAALSCPFAQYYVAGHDAWKHILPGNLHFTTC